MESVSDDEDHMLESYPWAVKDPPRGQVRVSGDRNITQPSAPGPGSHQALIDQDMYPGVRCQVPKETPLPEHPTPAEFEAWIQTRPWSTADVACPVPTCTSIFKPNKRLQLSLDDHAEHRLLNVMGHCKGELKHGSSHARVHALLQARQERKLLSDGDFHQRCLDCEKWRATGRVPHSKRSIYNYHVQAVERGGIQVGEGAEDFYDVWGSVLSGCVFN